MEPSHRRYEGVLRALACAVAVLAMVAASAHAQAPAANHVRSVPVWREISGGRFEYEVGPDDWSRSIAARFGQPDTTVFQHGEEPDPGARIAIDNRHVAPAVVDDGVVINVPQRMLFVFRDKRLAAAWPTTVGRPDWPTPLGSFSVAAHRLNPTWHVPPAIQAEMEDEGLDAPAEVKPGAKNPLGSRLLALDHGGIAIHSTNRPLSIFLFASHGCIRLAPDSAERLFSMVADSEPVEIIYQPVTLAVLADGRIYLESDTDPYRLGSPDLGAVRTAARAAGVESSIDWAAASRALIMVEGVARRIDTAGQPMADSAPRS